MSFFGLTSFGPENIFQSNKINSNAFTLYSIDEYYNSYESLCLKYKTNGLTKDNLAELIKKTINIDPLKEEVDLFKSYLNTTDNNLLITWDIIQKALKDIKEYYNNLAKSSNNFSSNIDYLNKRYKHTRNDKNSSNAYKQPVSSSQVYGFYSFKEKDLNNERLPKRKCEETKFAEALTLTGNNFMK